MRALLFTLLLFITCIAIAENITPYKGQDNRDIKALSQQDIDNYLAGSGMGFAKAAELNSYPGPRHVLDLSDKLSLTQTQKQQSQAIFDSMNAEAKTLGKQLIEQERALDAHFSSGTINNENLQTLVTNIGHIQAQIRTTHLAAHLQQKAILTPQQITMYNHLRGYTGNDPQHHHMH